MFSHTLLRFVDFIYALICKNIVSGEFSKVFDDTTPNYTWKVIKNESVDFIQDTKS